MITILNRKKLMLDISSTEVTRVTEILKKNNIPYYLKTTRSNTIMGAIWDVNLQHKWNQTNSVTQKQAKYIYTIYVKKKQYKEAVYKVYGGPIN